MVVDKLYSLLGIEHLLLEGGGKLNGILQFRKSTPQDEGKQRQAALLALGTAPEMKNLVLVDDDVDIFDPYDVEWALTTRFRPDKDLVTVPGVRCHIGKAGTSLTVFCGFLSQKNRRPDAEKVLRPQPLGQRHRL